MHIFPMPPHLRAGDQLGHEGLPQQSTCPHCRWASGLGFDISVAVGCIPILTMLEGAPVPRIEP